MGGLMMLTAGFSMSKLSTLVQGVS